jgi:3-hydroxyacyl-[acyl-carrier-protein] dehydratase
MMRWFWIDQFKEFVRGRKARAVKAVTLAEEHLHDHFPGAAMMPTTLVIEGMAQTAGILVADSLDYKKQVVLAKVAKADFQFDAVPGDTLEYLAEIVETMAGGSLVNVTSRVGERLHGEAELYFAHLETGVVVPRLFKTDEMHRWLDNLRIYDVAVNVDGSPVVRGTGE